MCIRDRYYLVYIYLVNCIYGYVDKLSDFNKTLTVKIFTCFVGVIVLSTNNIYCIYRVFREERKKIRKINLRLEMLFFHVRTCWKFCSCFCSEVKIVWGQNSGNTNSGTKLAVLHDVWPDTYKNEFRSFIAVCKKVYQTYCTRN